MNGKKCQIFPFRQEIMNDEWKNGRINESYSDHLSLKAMKNSLIEVYQKPISLMDASFLTLEALFLNTFYSMKQKLHHPL